MSEFLSGLVSFLSGGIFGSVRVQNDSNTEEEIHKLQLQTTEKKNENDYSSFDGVVTSYFNNRGLINNEIYFSQNVVIGNEQPKIGDNVSVEATRLHSEGGWVAKKVQILNLWDTDSDKTVKKPEKETFVGSVTLVDNSRVTVFINSDLVLTSRKFKTGYKPFCGDWVQIEVWGQYDSNESAFLISEENVICVSPLREKKVHGTITELLKGYGFINETIYFSFAVCERGVILNIGDSVIADIIESKQRRGDWRATFVFRKMSFQQSLKTRNESIIINQHISITDNLNFGDIQLNCKSCIEVYIRLLSLLHKFFYLCNYCDYQVVKVVLFQLSLYVISLLST